MSGVCVRAEGSASPDSPGHFSQDVWHYQPAQSLPPSCSWVIFISKLLHSLSQIFLLPFLSITEAANWNSTTVNNECFFRSCSIHWGYKGISGNRVIPTAPTVLNPSCPWPSQPFQPWGTCRWHSQGHSCRKPWAMGAPPLQKSDTDLCRVEICTWWENGSSLALQQSVCSGNIYWPSHTIDDTINGNLVPVKMHVIDPTSLVWRVFYKLRAKCCDLTDELQ